MCPRAAPVAGTRVLAPNRVEKAQPTMTNHAVTALTTLAEGGGHQSLEPALTGGSALFILLLLLFITTRFNRDR
jgi:hypothetical protein